MNGRIQKSRISKEEHERLAEYLATYQQYPPLKTKEFSRLFALYQPWNARTLQVEENIKEVTGRLKALVKQGDSPEECKRLEKRLRRLHRRFQRLSDAREMHSAPLVYGNIRLVVAVAKGFAGQGVELVDLIHDGAIGLRKALIKFDPAFETQFSTYAVWWIKQAVRRSVNENGHQRIVRMPSDLHTMKSKRGRIVARHKLLFGQSPNEEEILAALGCTTPEERKKARRQLEKLESVYGFGQSFSLQAKVGGEDEERSATYEDAFKNDAPNPEETYLARERLDLLRKTFAAVVAKGRISERDLDVLRHRFGLDGCEEMTLAELGEKYGLTRERIRQIEVKALATLRAAKDQLLDSI